MTTPRSQVRRDIGRTGISVSQLGVGGTAFGNIFRRVDISDVNEAVDAAFDAGLNYFDTAPVYGYGVSETRLGEVLAPRPRDSYVISSKVGWRLDVLPEAPATPGLFVDVPPRKQVMDFSRETTLRSLDETLTRLQTDRLDIVFVHDPDEGASINPDDIPGAPSHVKEVMAETYPALDELRGQGVIGAIGVGMCQHEMLTEFAGLGDFDCFLLAGRYTLLEQAGLQPFLAQCAEQHISVISGSPFNSGILATGATTDATYNYFPASPEVLHRVAQIEKVGERHGVALPAAALQFALGHPAVVSVIPGARSKAEMQQNLEQFDADISADYWAELKELNLIDPGAPTP
ncbi:MAG: D-threo-aldose 1-dehydrogenase [Frankiales bacterium]|nr:D-threo-aldose 1-dehydrogenase [Frankiales bacterium]